MAMEWWHREKKEEATKEPELPKELVETRARVEEMGSKLDTMLSALTAITESTATEKAERVAAAQRAQEAERRRQAESSKLSPEDLAANMFSDPEGTVKQLTDPLAKELMEMRAANVRREVFEDTEKFEYYSGDFKTEVDKLIAAQPLAFRNNPASVENVYYTLLGKKSKEISEGKIKSRFAAASTSSSNAGKTAEEKGKLKIDVDDQIRRAAKLVGMDPEAYAALVATDAEEGNIAYV
jgi:hypothetical protein